MSKTLPNIELRLSKLLLGLIMLRYPGFKKPDLKIWSQHIDKMIRLDKRKVGDIEAVIKWCQSDSFWNNNILSTKKLRDKFDQLYLKMPKQKVYIPEPEPVRLPRIHIPKERMDEIIKQGRKAGAEGKARAKEREGNRLNRKERK